ncbi:hypothetical protein BTA51_06395 [Hahella sp. CCB-MM4]|uniref:hypothetical protein n=1 Tax=Hahella sp. (strain CCB-MM4) TaxID=1926491 RepID=UPI000B9A9B92|nr:hypothetical protein [Hahella sp. CCB-MM4]OZG74619.1 hypothetical protein BTA51_06395 [Hahella sp. CCB-MM4]
MTDASDMAIQLSKILVTIATVMGLAWIAERVSTRVAGVLAGFPLGTAIALAYIGIEQGPEFAAVSARHTLLGFIAAQVMTTFYWLCLRFRYHVVIAPAAAVAAFAVTNGLLSLISGDLASNFVLVVLATIGFGFWYRIIPNQNIQQAINLSTLAVLVRGAISACCVVAVTLLAYLGSSTIAGLFAAFPITFFPLLFIIHINYGQQPVYTLIRYYPLGLGSLIIYSLLVALSYDSWGIAAGTAIGLAGAIAYLGAYHQLRKWLSAERTA